MNAGEWTILRPHVVRWIECDLYAHVNHAAYLTLFEDLRIEHWKKLSGRLPGLHPGPSPVVASIEARYLREVGFGDEVMLGCRTTSFRRSSYVHEYALWKAGELCFSARCVCVVTEGGAKAALPPELRAKLVAEGAKEE